MVTPEGLPVIDALCRVLEDGGMGTYRALQTMLAGRPGTRAISRSVKPGTKQEKPKNQIEPEEIPLALAF
ncbi:MAG: hypothetical protein QME66_04760 [Candidatus Eisenbacteria bacterium]|nr:hypothetical protein [Candidatus Eisenbacteria bacterium]